MQSPAREHRMYGRYTNACCLSAATKSIAFLKVSDHRVWTYACRPCQHSATIECRQETGHCAHPGLLSSHKLLLCANARLAGNSCCQLIAGAWRSPTVTMDTQKTRDQFPCGKWLFGGLDSMAWYILDLPSTPKFLLPQVPHLPRFPDISQNGIGNPMQPSVIDPYKAPFAICSGPLNLGHVHTSPFAKLCCLASAVVFIAILIVFRLRMADIDCPLSHAHNNLVKKFKQTDSGWPTINLSNSAWELRS